MYEVLYRVPTAGGNWSPLRSKICKNADEVDDICLHIEKFGYQLTMIRVI